MNKKFFLFLFLLSLVSASTFAYYQLNITTNFVPPPIQLYQAQIPASIGANQTSANISYTVTTTTYNATSYSSFRIGYDGWKNSTSSSLITVSWINTGGNPDGFIRISGVNIPTGGDIVFGNANITTFLVFPFIPSGNAYQLQFDHQLSRSGFGNRNFDLYVYIYDATANTLTQIYSISDKNNFGWTTRTVSFTYSFQNNHEYFLIFRLNVRYATGSTNSFNYDLDNIRIDVINTSYRSASIALLNVTDVNGLYWVRLKFDQTISFSGSNYVALYLLNGRNSTSVIYINNNIASTSMTSFIIFNSAITLPDPSLRTGLIMLKAVLTPGSSIQFRIFLEYTTNNVNQPVLVQYPITITISA